MICSLVTINNTSLPVQNEVKYLISIKNLDGRTTPKQLHLKLRRFLGRRAELFIKTNSYCTSVLLSIQT